MSRHLSLLRVFCLAAPFPPRGPPGLSSPASPVLRAALTAFLPIASRLVTSALCLLSLDRLIRISPATPGPACLGLEFGGPVPFRHGLGQRRKALPRSWGTLFCLRPGLRPRQGRGVLTVFRPPRCCPRLSQLRGPPQSSLFRGSIQTLDSRRLLLPTLCYRRAGKASFRLAGSPLSDRIGYLLGPCSRFQLCTLSYIVSSLTKLCVAHCDPK